MKIYDLFLQREIEWQSSLRLRKRNDQSLQMQSKYFCKICKLAQISYSITIIQDRKGKVWTMLLLFVSSWFLLDQSNLDEDNKEIFKKSEDFYF